MLGGVGKPMTRLAGEIADAFIVIPFHTPAFLESHTLPAIDEGLAKNGRTRADFQINAQCMIATGIDEKSYREAFERTRYQIAFYGSTPTYKKCLDAEGWDDMQPDLQKMTRENRWNEMPSLITDDIVKKIAVCGTPEEVAEGLWQRFSPICDRVSVMTTYTLQEKSGE